MPAVDHMENHPAEFQVVLPLSRFEDVLVEEWNDAVFEMLEPTHSPAHTVAVIVSHDAAVKELLDRVKQRNVAFVLNDCKLGQHLDAQCHISVTGDSDVKATFAVGKADHPLGIQVHE